MCWPFIDICFMFLKRVNRSGTALTASNTSLEGERLPRACGLRSTIPRRCKGMSFASRNDGVGQLWGGDLQRRKPILGVMSSRMGPRCGKGSRFLVAANNTNWFSASAVWPSRTRALAQLLDFWGNKGYTKVFFISGSNCLFPFENSRVSGVHTSEPFSQTDDF